MKLFAKRNLNKLRDAILKADLSLLKKQLNKVSTEHLNAPLFATPTGNISATELAIIHRQPKALEQLLRVGADPNQPSSQQLPLLYLALQQPHQSLALISTLLQNGCDYDFIADADNLPDTALLACFEYCADNDLMLHISRLVEYGAAINKTGLNGGSPLQEALRKEQLSLIQFMIQSGAELPDGIPQNWCSEATANYARRCAEDLRIRKLMMG